ncbi:MAG: RecX family transcriptional regulator [Bacteroidaceae bacterium]|nr:RecX family transcriptional regulator [Bacteroidaceae bacterium]
MTYETALPKMAALCSSAEYCEKDLREKMRRGGLPDADADRVIERLYEEGFLSAERFCHAYVRDKVLFARWGRMKIEMGLRQKGLPADEIAAAIADEMDSEGSRADYLQKLCSAMEAKARTLKDEDPRVRRAKLIRFALSRGYTMDDLDETLLK